MEIERKAVADDWDVLRPSLLLPPPLSLLYGTALDSLSLFLGVFVCLLLLYIEKERETRSTTLG